MGRDGGGSPHLVGGLGDAKDVHTSLELCCPLSQRRYLQVRNAYNSVCIIIITIKTIITIIEQHVTVRTIV
jgi:hypothetical protein